MVKEEELPSPLCVGALERRCRRRLAEAASELRERHLGAPRDLAQRGHRPQELLQEAHLVEERQVFRGRLRLWWRAFVRRCCAASAASSASPPSSGAPPPPPAPACAPLRVSCVASAPLCLLFRLLLRVSQRFLLRVFSVGELRRR